MLHLDPRLEHCPTINIAARAPISIIRCLGRSWHGSSVECKGALPSALVAPRSGQLCVVEERSGPSAEIPAPSTLPVCNLRARCSLLRVSDRAAIIVTE